MSAWYQNRAKFEPRRVHACIVGLNSILVIWESLLEKGVENEAFDRKDSY